MTVRWNVCPDCDERHERGAACYGALPDVEVVITADTSGFENAVKDAYLAHLRGQIAEALYQWTVAQAAASPFRLLARDERALRENSLARADAILPVVEDALAAVRASRDRAHQAAVAFERRAIEADKRAEHAEAKVAALMDERGAEQIDRIQAERDALPKDERAHLDAADAPLLRIQLAGMTRQVAEAKAEAERASTAAAREIWVKFGFDTILMWKGRAEQALRERDEARQRAADYQMRDDDPDSLLVELDDLRATVRRMRELTDLLDQATPDAEGNEQIRRLIGLYRKTLDPPKDIHA
ncbi:hypothetical protein [Actinomadura litoris]|uniref:hypothetical protein n=1 Tax=Actinomadura litoris TaxID=2678616 RepID=UPI001FA802AC|nr:hypothetical protein [Actinomadura litoris]